MYINLHIPVNEYGAIATLAAVANMPLDKYVVNKMCNGLDAEQAIKEARQAITPAPAEK